MGHGNCTILGNNFGKYRRTELKISKRMSQEVPRSSEQLAAMEGSMDPAQSGSEPPER